MPGTLATGRPASSLGVTGVPSFVANGKVALSASRPPDLFRQAFEQVGAVAAAGTE